jgi:hypothetical protein
MCECCLSRVDQTGCWRPSILLQEEFGREWRRRNVEANESTRTADLSPTVSSPLPLQEDEQLTRRMLAGHTVYVERTGPWDDCARCEEDTNAVDWFQLTLFVRGDIFTSSRCSTTTAGITPPA